MNFISSQVFAQRAMPWIAMLMPVFVGASVFGSINGEAMSMSRYDSRLFLLSATRLLSVDLPTLVPERDTCLPSLL